MHTDINQYLIEGKRIRENILRKDKSVSDHSSNQSLSDAEEDSNQEIEDLSSSSEASSIMADSMNASAIVNRNLQQYINSMMVDFKDYPEHSTEYKFIQQCYANQLKSMFFAGVTNPYMATLLGQSCEEDPQQIKARENFEAELTDDNRKLIKHQKKLFEQIAQDFTCEKGKMESKKERQEKGVMG